MEYNQFIIKKLFTNISFCFLFLGQYLAAQNYNSWFTGNPVDSLASPSGGICLMGGATEDDNAMRWFLQRANGGDVLVLRASGSNGYNDYLYSQLGVQVNSVETILCNNASSSYDTYVLSRIEKAEAVWFAGGNQWNYISYWRNTPVDSLLNKALRERNIVIGGTSAGMAIMGGMYFSAQNGTVTSAIAMTNPYNAQVSIDSAAFLKNPYLENVITDTHFDNPDRRGRLATFLARIRQDYSLEGKAIACEEYTAVCIDSGGTALVYGGGPASNDKAYFVQVNCAIENNVPETCQPGTPLSWNQSGSALKVLTIPGIPSGNFALNLKNWQSAPNVNWQDWSVNNGQLTTLVSGAPDCSLMKAKTPEIPSSRRLISEPGSNRFRLMFLASEPGNFTVRMFNSFGLEIPIKISNAHHGEIIIEPLYNIPGIFTLTAMPESGLVFRQKIFLQP